MEGPVFIPCIKQLVFGFFTANDDAVKWHATAEQKKNFFQGTKKDLYAFLISCFSLPGSNILDMTDHKGKINDIP